MEQTPADVLDAAADLMLIRGVERGGFGWEEDGPRCPLGAIAEAMGIAETCAYSQLTDNPAATALALHLDVLGGWSIPGWADRTTDDFDIIDACRHAAKNLRAVA